MLTSEKVSASKLTGRKLENIHYLIYQKTIKKVTHDILYCCAKAKDVELQSNSCTNQNSTYSYPMEKVCD